MSDSKRITSIKKVALAGVSEGWDDSCYAYVIPVSYDDNIETSELDTAKMPQSKQVEYQKNFVKRHFVSGKIKVFNGTDFELDEMNAEDAVATIDIADRLYAEIMGIDLDPKDIRKAAEASALPTANESNTETSSSADSASASPAE